MAAWSKLMQPYDWQPFLEQLSHMKSIDSSIDLVFDTLDQMLLDGGYDEVNEVFPQVNFDKLDDSVSLGFLTITLWCKNNLPNRATFYQRLYKHIENNYPAKDVKSIMQGLE